jgi:TetR/AcrR family transcriptional repressor of mexJK operon
MKTILANAKPRRAIDGVTAKNRRMPAKPKSAPRPNQAGRPTSAELDRRKAKVMEVATAMFVQHGYAATSLVDIAKGAGVATRTLYQHFGDKEAIFLDVVSARESGAVFPQPSLADAPTLFDALMRIAHYVTDVSLRPRAVDLMRLMVAESRRFPQFMKRLCEKAFSRFRSNIASMFDELAEFGMAPALDSKATAAMFSDLILGSTPLLVYAGWLSSSPSEAELEAKVELFIVGRFGQAVADRARTPFQRKRTKATGKASVA